MSKLVKLKLASKKSLSCFMPSRMMATPGASSTLFPAPPDPELDGGKPKTAAEKPKSGPETLRADHARPENLERAMVVVESKDSPGKETPPKKEEEEEVLELKTPGFMRLFGCDNCEAESEENDDHHRHKAHDTSSDESLEDHAASSSAHHQPRHVIPVVHLRVPMKNEDDIRKVVAALQLRGVLEVACDLENQIVKVTGNVDPDRLLKKVKKVKRKSKLISYTNPVEMPVPPEPGSTFRSSAPPPPPPPPPPPYPFHPHSYEERLRPPPQGFPGGPFVRPNLHFASEAFYRPPNVRPPPAFYRDEAAFYPGGYVPRPPSSPPHYSSGAASFFHERSPPNLRRSTSPPRRRSYHYHDRNAPSFRPPPPPPRPPPPMRYPGGPPHHSSPWGPGPYDFYQVPDRMMHMHI